MKSVLPLFWCKWFAVKLWDCALCSWRTEGAMISSVTSGSICHKTITEYLPASHPKRVWESLVHHNNWIGFHEVKWMLWVSRHLCHEIMASSVQVL